VIIVQNYSWDCGKYRRGIEGFLAMLKAMAWVALSCAPPLNPKLPYLELPNILGCLQEFEASVRTTK
jgi:hypothetical protein